MSGVFRRVRVAILVTTTSTAVAFAQAPAGADLKPEERATEMAIERVLGPINQFIISPADVERARATQPPLLAPVTSTTTGDAPGQAPGSQRQ